MGELPRNRVSQGMIFTTSRKYGGFVIGILWMACMTVPRPVAAGVPLPAEQAGYMQLTFSSTFPRNEVDLDAPPTTGHKWYLWRFFGKSAKTEALEFNKDNTLILKGDITGPGGQIATAAPAGNASGFVGQAFGGGAYIEATLAFDPDDVTKMGYMGHPAFWSMALEHLAPPRDSVMPLNKDEFKHFIEVDFFEYDLRQYLHAINVYGGATHDWYGVWRKTCPTGFCSNTNSDIKRWVPEKTDFKQFHRYAVLWKTATAERNGYVQYYFDDQPVGSRVSWSQCKMNARPGTANYMPFCILDQQHLVLILGTGVGEPLTVKEVRVFQASSNGNLEK